MTERQPELRVVTSSDAGLATLELISQARQSLAEARTLPDIRRVMEAASVAADAAERAAKLFNAERRAAEVVEAATAAANDAAAVRIEAQAKAGELLKRMAEHGERARTGDRQPGRESRAATLGELGVSRSDSSRWQQVADVPEDVRQEYVEETKAAHGEVSTAGLLRHAKASTGPAPAATADRSEMFSVDREAAIASRQRLADELQQGRVDGAVNDAQQREAIYTLIYELRGLCGAPAVVELETLVDAIDADDRHELLSAVRDLGAWLAELEGELTRQGAGEEGGREAEP
jgi:hypothetical protein